MTTRDRAQTAVSRADELEYFLFIRGLSPQCSWQELKDVIRNLPPEGYVRQAHTDNDNGTRWGHITILNKRKAYDVYEQLYHNGWGGQSIRLTLVVKDEANSNSLRRLRGPQDSLVHSSQRFLSSEHLYPPSSSAPLISAAPVMSQASFAGNFESGSTGTFATFGTASSISPMHHSPYPVAMQTPLLPSHQAFPHGFVPCQRPSITGAEPALLPVVSYGRDIYLCNLPWSVNQEDIKEHLATAGTIDRCITRKDAQRSPKHKLTAVVTFRTPQQAQAAIDRFHGSTWKGCKILVKFDRGNIGSGTSAARNGSSAPKPTGKEDRPKRRGSPLVVPATLSDVPRRPSRADSSDSSDLSD